MGVREIDRFLEQWRMDARDLHRRLILAPTPRERALRQAQEMARHLAAVPRMGGFGVDHAGIIDRHGYSIEEHGKPPDFALEVASVTTGQGDYTRKRDDYAVFGAPEYWRFDLSRAAG